MKSRILSDCWYRSPTLGLLPLEVQILLQLKENPHPNIVKLVDHFSDEDYYYIIMELHGFGMDLFDFIELNKKMTENEIRYIFSQAVQGIKHLHDLGIVHRDIKVNRYSSFVLFFFSGLFVISIF